MQTKNEEAVALVRSASLRCEVLRQAIGDASPADRVLGVVLANVLDDLKRAVVALGGSAS